MEIGKEKYSDNFKAVIGAKNLDEMSEEELRQIQEKVDILIRVIEEEKEELKKRKKEYDIIQPEPEYRTNYHKLWRTIKEIVYSGGVVDIRNIEQIHSQCRDQLPIPHEKKYPCPVCGEVGNLHVEKYSDYDSIWGTGTSVLKVACSNCGFVCPARYQDREENAWNAFHEWLVKEGYLESTAKEV